QHQGRREERRSAQQDRPANEALLLRAQQSDRYHHQKKRAEVPKGAGLIEDTLRPAIDAAVEPDILRSEARWRRKLEVEVDACEQSGSGGGEKQYPRGAPVGSAWSASHIEKHIHRN